MSMNDKTSTLVEMNAVISGRKMRVRKFLPAGSLRLASQRSRGDFDCPSLERDGTVYFARPVGGPLPASDVVLGWIRPDGQVRLFVPPTPELREIAALLFADARELAAAPELVEAALAV